MVNVKGKQSFQCEKLGKEAARQGSQNDFMGEPMNKLTNITSSGFLISLKINVTFKIIIG
jgi:hypothetical protein